METTTIDAHLSMPPEPRVRSFPMRVLVIGLLVFVALAVAYRTFLFIEPWHEHSDYAVDALHIERARHFEAIHGNYSRFGFYHPGPGFYYVYALGEQLFYRWLPLVPSPYNAHALAGLILQCFFFAAALAIADQWVRRPLFLPLALVTIAIHLTLAGNAFIDIWPPRVLLMPFLCFLVGVASVAAGRVQHLPLTVLAGCFLVHGHVAQPLYVVVLFLLACGATWRRVRRHPGGGDARPCAHRTAYLLSAGCIALFLVPIVIDLAAGAQSNLAHILAFHTIDRPGKPLWKALVYFCSFFGYVQKTELFLSATGPDRATAIGEHLAGYFVWAAIITIVVFQVRRLWRRPNAEQPFVLALTAFTFLAFLLSLYWGMVQIGPMYEYNGYFFHAILGCMLLLLCVAISTWPVPKPRGAELALYTVAAVVVWQQRHVPLSIDYSTNQILPAVRQALNADPSPGAPKYLLFNRSDWGEAVSIGLALNRAHHAFRADTDWGPRFAPDGAFEPAGPTFDMEGVSTWRLSRRGPRDGGTSIRDNLRVYFRPLPLDPAKTVIDCAENGNLELYALFGFASPFHSAAWTMRPYAGLVFEAPPISTDLLVTFFAEPFAIAGEQPRQPMTLSVNGRMVFTGALAQPGSVTARVPAEAWNAKNPVMMVLHFPAALSPSDRGDSLDARMLGWHVQRIVFESAR